MSKVRHSAIKVVTHRNGDAEFYLRRGLGWSVRPKYTCVGVSEQVLDEFLGFLKLLGFTITRGFARPRLTIISTEFEVVCDCGNRDTICAPLTAAPPCSAGCGRRMIITGAVGPG